MPCPACPFVESYLSVQTQNLGCLPSAGEVLKLCLTKNKNWGCHEQPEKLCTGYAQHLKEEGIVFDNTKQIISPTIWFHEGPKGV